MSSALNRSSAIRRFEGSDAIEIRDGITFDFYTGLPHMTLHLPVHLDCNLRTDQTGQHQINTIDSYSRWKRKTSLFSSFCHLQCLKKHRHNVTSGTQKADTQGWVFKRQTSCVVPACKHPSLQCSKQTL